MTVRRDHSQRWIIEADWLAHYLPANLSVLKLSRLVARRIWGFMLWLIRRPWMKKVQVGSMSLLPKSMRTSAVRSIKRQNAFARKYGLNWLTGVVAFFLITVGSAWTYQAAVLCVESGILNPPARMAGTLSGTQE